MTKKVLMGSLLLILSVAVLASVTNKKPILQKQNANTLQKIELISQLDQQDRYYERYLSRRTAVIDIPDATVLRGNTKISDDRIERKEAFNPAIPIADYYGNGIAQGELLTPLQKTFGTSIGSSALIYSLAYQGRNIAMGSDGSVHAVWSDGDEVINSTYYVKSTDKGENWSTPVMINDGYYGYKPAIDVDPNDPTKIHVAYVGYMNEGETRTVRYIKSEDGGDTWGASILITGSQVNTNNPDIVVDASGNPHVAFDSYADTYIRYNYSADGGTTWFTEPEVLNTGFGNETFGASLAIDSDGNPHAFFGGDGVANSWGDKNVYWNWRDMSTEEWQEVPPVQLSSDEVGAPYPSMVFDSNGIGHCFYDAAGTVSSRSVWYRQYDPDVGWGDPVEFPASSFGGSTFMAQAGIDDNDNIYVAYIDALGGAQAAPEPGEGDVFVGTNISGDWEYTNVSGNGPNVNESHVNVARYVSSSDSLFHCLYALGPEAVEIVYDVGYPWLPNPKCGVNQLSDTYDTTGPFKVTAGTSDLDGTVDVCSLFVFVNATAAGSYNMLLTAPDVWEAEFTISGEEGDEVSYMAKAIDNDGLEGESFLTLFDILEPTNPGADILLVGDDIRFPAVYTGVLDELGYVYEYWDIDTHSGIDASVTTFGWNNILVGGWGISSVPTRDYTDDPYAEALDNGVNLAVLSQDWFYAQGEDAYEITFDPGDMAYDYFQIGSGNNDPDEKDSLVIGIPADPISGDWSVDPIEFNIPLFESQLGQTGTNWMDWTTATGSGVDCFYAYNEAMGAGVRYDGGTFKTIHLPFMYSWMMDSTASGIVGNEDAIQLMENILDWFGAKAPPQLSEVTGPRYGVYGNGPFDVSVEAKDLKKVSSVQTVQVCYMKDDAADWTCIDLTASNDTYTGQIPQLAQTDTFLYKFEAVDDDELTGLSDVYQFWTTGQAYTPGILLLYCGDEAWVGIDYTESVDSIVTGTLDALSVPYDYWDVDQFGPPDYQTVLSNYPAVIWHGYGDWDPTAFPMYTEDNPFDPYLKNGGRLLFSSEEMMGTWYGWPGDYSPGPGETLYDILNVSWIGCDWGYDTTGIAHPMEPLNIGMDTVLTLEPLPYGFMGDLADPLAYGMDPMPNTVYIFYAWLSDFSFFYPTAWRYIDPTYGFRTITMPFCIANLDSANRAAFLTNALAWFAHPTGVDQPETGLPKTFALYNNRPNPFNPETVISYDLPKISQVELVVYNIMGQKIRTLFNGQRNAGRFDVVWDGKDDAGVQVASGVYIFQIVAGDFVQSHKMMLLR